MREDSNEYDCPSCGKEDIGMCGHDCQQSKDNHERIKNGEEAIYVPTRFNRSVICPNCNHHFVS